MCVYMFTYVHICLYMYSRVPLYKGADTRHSFVHARPEGVEQSGTEWKTWFEAGYGTSIERGSP